MSEITIQATARQVLETLPLTMRIVTAEFRRGQHPIVPAQLGVLFLLSTQPFNLSSLAEQQAVSLPTMSNTITSLVRQGLVQRSRDESDRRMVIIEITPVGQELLDTILRQMVARVSQYLDELSPEELAALQAGLTIMQTLFTS
ncbi:MAG: MarR family transcriptional regulator [Anaerolineales bacterium]|nr:MarR family transcriptional regulator [Anaerolineales bacterium]MCB8990052.1 MarR family transcriptional regulator [Ardenticatenaceae bacterium]MCB9005637.1 MarR family transcriptional regulator [Ardenticatenaceae bacterium]